MSEVTQKICDGCGAAGKKGAPTYVMMMGLSHDGDAPKVHQYDVHGDSRCVKALCRKMSGEADEMLQDTLGGGSASN